MGGSAPTPPSPTAGIGAAQQVSDIQQGYNTGAAAGSNYNQSNPFGNLSYIQTGVGPNGVPTYTAMSNFSPDQAPLWAQTLMSKGLAGGQGTDLLNQANYGAQNPNDVIGNSASGIVGDVMHNELSYLQPFQQTERTQLDTQLRNQGLSPGNPAYDNAMRSMDTSHSLAVNKLIGDTTPQAYSTAQSMYQLPMQMAMALGGYGSPVNPSSMYGVGAAIQPANMTGAYSSTQQALMQQYQAQMQQYASGQAGMFGIPAAVLGGMGAGGAFNPAIAAMGAAI